MGTEIKVAIIGVGNCASSLVQGIEFYRDAEDGQAIPGLMHPVLGGYRIRDIRFTAAFDVDANKVGTDLAEAIYAPPNNTFRFADVPTTGVRVDRGMTHDGLGRYLSDVIQKAPGPTADIVRILKDTETDVVINYLPVGAESATKWYVEQVLQAGCAFINCIPVFIARQDDWGGRFREQGLPIIGDDIKSQVGATILHRTMTRLFADRGVRLDRTYQLNFGGNTDFLNMLERERLESKKISKTNAVTLPDRLRDAGRRRARRPLRSRPLAAGPQVVPHPHGGNDLRRGAADGRDEARGLGQPELGRRGDRRHPLRQARARPRRVRPAARAVGVLHEVAARAVARRCRPRPARGLHRG